jgi:putative ABC transport system ATP-binding protein
VEAVTPPVAAEHVSKSFVVGGEAQPVLEDCTIRFEPGRLYLLLGPSGSGKTTLLTILAGFQRPSAGSVSLFGRRVEDYSRAELQKLRAGRISFVFQSFLLVDARSVAWNILFPARFAGLDRAEIAGRVSGALAQLGMAGRAGARAGDLSHGEKQRVVIARALVYRSPLVLADEPTASIDHEQGLFAMGLLRSLARDRGSCVLVASHDTRLAELADTVLRLDGRRLAPVDGR